MVRLPLLPICRLLMSSLLLTPSITSSLLPCSTDTFAVCVSSAPERYTIADFNVEETIFLSSPAFTIWHNAINSPAVSMRFMMYVFHDRCEPTSVYINQPTCRGDRSIRAPFCPNRTGNEHRACRFWQSGARFHSSHNTSAEFL